MEEGKTDHMNEQFQTQATRRETSDQKKSKLPLIIAAVVLLVLGGGAFYFLRSGSESEPVEIVNEEVEVPTSAPIPTDEPEVEIQRDSVTIQILNGSGVSGEAGYFQGILANLGYKDIEIGNASGDDKVETTVTFSEDLAESVVKELTKKLEDTYKDVNVKTSGSTKFDVEIVVGLRKGQSAPTQVPTKAPTATPAKDLTPTTTPTPTATLTPSA